MSAAEMVAGRDPGFDFDAAWRAVRPDDVATLIYTSGTTGDPKCVEISHANLLLNLFALDAVLGIEFGDRSTSFLPSAHIADRMSALYAQEVFGVQVTAVSDPGAIAAALLDVRPTFGRQCQGVGKAEVDDRVRGGERTGQQEATEVGMGDVGRRPTRRGVDRRDGRACRTRRRVGER